MRRFLMSLAVGLSALALAAPARADEHDGYKEYLKQLKKQQKRQAEFFREQQKRYEEQWREQAKREREYLKGEGKYRPFGYRYYQPGQLAYPPYGPGPIGPRPSYPGSGYPPGGYGQDYPPYYPPPAPPSGYQAPYYPGGPALYAPRAERYNPPPPPVPQGNNPYQQPTPGTGSVWVYGSRNEGSFHEMGNGQWVETNPSAQLYYTEIGRGSGIVDLFDPNRRIYVRLTGGQLYSRAESQPNWDVGYSGNWAQ
jgi:hypothetical protein